MPLRQKFRRERAIVIDLTIEDDPEGSVFIGQRLVARLQVDDAQTTHSDAETAVRVKPTAIRPATGQHLSHSEQPLTVRWPRAVTAEDAEDAAHLSLSAPSRYDASSSSRTRPASMSWRPGPPIERAGRATQTDAAGTVQSGRDRASPEPSGTCTARRPGACRIPLLPPRWRS